MTGCVGRVGVAVWLDPRIGDDESRRRTRALLERWATLEPAERQTLTDRPAPTASDFNERELWYYAQAVNEVNRIVSDSFRWSQIDFENAERNPRFYLALITADGVQRPHLVSAAKTYLNSSPVDDWLFVFGPRAQTGGLSPIQRVPAEHLLELCDILDRLEGVELKPAVRLALLTLAHYDNQEFLDLVAGIENPIVLKLIADWHHENPALSRHLACSAHPFVATRGVHNHLAYLRTLESYAGSAVRDLDLFGQTAIDVRPAIRHRREIEQEIHDSLSSLFEKLGGAGKRSQILGEALARSLLARPTEKRIVDWQTLQVVARVAAQSVAADPAAAEVGILKGLQADPVRGIAGTELVAAELGDHPALAREWRRHLLAHLEKRLQVPPRDAFEAAQSSETDPLVPNALIGEGVYIDCAGRALGVSVFTSKGPLFFTSMPPLMWPT